jgi:hypothetical protein
LRAGNATLTGRAVLETFLDGGALAFISRENPVGQISLNDEVSARIIARVIGVTAEQPDQAVLRDLEDLVIGDLLYKAIHAISEGDTFDPVAGKMADVKVFLDTGILFRCLGYFGSAFERPAQEMLDIFRATGCKLHTFEHNVDEVVEGLHAVAQRLSTGGAYGPIVTYALENGLDRLGLIELAAALPGRLADDGIVVTALPPRSNELTIDELLLDWRVETDVKQNNPTARRRDVDSLAAIYRLREGQPQTSLEKCPAIFVTANKSLADASTRFFQKMFREDGQRNIVQICMTDVVITTRLWLKVPTKFQNIPRNQILAHAHSSLRPSTEIMARFLEMIRTRVNDRRLKPELAVEISFSHAVRGVLALESENDPERLNDDVVDEVIASAIRTIRVQQERIRDQATARGARAAELKAMKEIEILEKKLESTENSTAITRSERDAAADVIDQLSREIEALRASRVVSERLSQITVSVVSFLVWIILSCGIVVPLLLVAFPSLVTWWKLQLIGALISVFLSVLTVIGVSHFDVLHDFENWTVRIWEGVMRAFLRSPTKTKLKRAPRF